MLVLSRKPGTSIIYTCPDETCVITVLEIFPRHVSILVSRALSIRPGELDVRTLRVDFNSSVEISATNKVTLVDIRPDRALVGIEPPMHGSVHRLEVYEALKAKGGV